ncbi:MAG: GNAT family N-acetyltransferase [Acidobacteria bacterium]|nr:GNAT family N-acetyltransferase [Acidobacteriota bacterium]
MSLAIRAAAPSDAPTIAAFNAAMARETEHIELDAKRLLDGVRAVLADRSKGFYTVAETEGRVVGQMMITFEWSDWRNGTFWWIQSVYVHPDFRSRGVFKELYAYITERAKSAGDVCGLRLYVEQENSRAQQTYQRLGMAKAPYAVYEVDFVLRRG